VLGLPLVWSANGTPVNAMKLEEFAVDPLRNIAAAILL